MSEKNTNNTVCEICGSGPLSELYPMEMMYGKEGPFEYVCCADCGATYQAHKLQDYSRFYNASYYSFKFQQPTTLSQRLRQLKRRLRNQYYYFGESLLGRLLTRIRPCPVNHLSRHVKLQRDMSILEIGCGSGELLHEIADMGVRRAVGIDPFVAQSHQYHSGATVFKSTIYELSRHVPNEMFDVVLFNHALEHSLTPLQDIQEAAKFLKPSGEIVVRIPVSDSEISRSYGPYWWSLDAPRHIYLFSAKSMHLVAEKCGLVIKRTHFEGTIDDFIASEQHRSGITLLSDKSYVVSKDFSAFSQAQLQEFESRIAQQNENGTAALAGFVLGFPESQTRSQ
jgi:2-polyprenyl-3-methyl-5-hydroxy-6-metoxy-1,4-benzoquinol methylase